MFDLDTFIADCRTALGEPAPEVAIRELVARAVVHPVEVERVLGTPGWGGVTALHRSPELTILNVIWTPGMAVWPHDHRMWAVIGLYGGREDNVFYRRSPRGLTLAGNKQLETSDTVLLGKTVIHGVINPLKRFAGAIHVYGGDFFATPRSEFDPETFEERLSDGERGKRFFAEANTRWLAECAKAAPSGTLP